MLLPHAIIFNKSQIIKSSNADTMVTSTAKKVTPLLLSMSIVMFFAYKLLLCGYKLNNINNKCIKKQKPSKSWVFI
ncbi:hypothetical protein PESP_a3562 [Pseudoalteromonas espejiana DSM 9414]|nr:hypothetical protein PESP_a3562 [Pseudoalteromonas espejiana DSM 9414]